MGLFDAVAQTEGVRQVPKTVRTGFTDFVMNLGLVRADLIETVFTGFKTAQRFLQGFLECSADRHDFADGFHLSRQTLIGFGEFLKSKTRGFDNHIVDCRFKRSRCRAARDFISQFVKRIAHRKFRGDLSDREAGRFRG